MSWYSIHIDSFHTQHAFPTLQVTTSTFPLEYHSSFTLQPCKWPRISQSLHSILLTIVITLNRNSTEVRPIEWMKSNSKTCLLIREADSLFCWPGYWIVWLWSCREPPPGPEILPILKRQDQEMESSGIIRASNQAVPDIALDILGLLPASFCSSLLSWVF